MKDITPRPKDKDKEYLFGGIVVIKKYEGKGFDIDFSELFRKLRDLFKKKE
jgi:hypothetical protein